MKNTNNGSFVCLNDATDCTDLNICTTVVTYAPYINSTVCFEYDTYITTGDTTISSSIDERGQNTKVLFMVRYLVFNTSTMYGTFGVL
jgi:hypothetical protein